MHFSIRFAWSESFYICLCYIMLYVLNWNGSGSPEMAPRIIIGITDVLIIPALSMQVCGKCFERRLAVTSECVPEGRSHGPLHLQPLRQVNKSQENTVWSCWAGVILILFDVINQRTHINANWTTTTTTFFAELLNFMSCLFCCCCVFIDV